MTTKALLLMMKMKTMEAIRHHPSFPLVLLVLHDQQTQTEEKRKRKKRKSVCLDFHLSASVGHYSNLSDRDRMMIMWLCALSSFFSLLQDEDNKMKGRKEGREGGREVEEGTRRLMPSKPSGIDLRKVSHDLVRSSLLKSFRGLCGEDTDDQADVGTLCCKDPRRRVLKHNRLFRRHSQLLQALYFSFDVSLRDQGGRSKKTGEERTTR